MAWDCLTEAEKGYIGGLFDGEGSISISHYKRDNTFVLRCNFINSHKKTIDWLYNHLKEFRFRKIARDVRKDNRHNLIVYSIEIGKQLANKEFLEKILPYIRIKKEQAELALIFLDYVLNRESLTFTPRNRKEMELFYRRMQKLNNSKRGVR